MGNGYTAIIEYNRMHLGIQVSDLYRFMRKVMEKHGWNMYYLFLYPEKYWKQLNFYFNANKAWIPERNIDKLHGLEEQQQLRNSFLRRLKADCGA